MPLPTRAQLLKRFVLTACGAGSFWQLGLRNRLAVSGREHLADLPERNVLFVSNHQTWFLDVIAIYHGLTRSHASPLSGVRAPLHVSFIAAQETMERRGLLPRFFAAGGAVCVKRTWREGEEEISRAVDPDDLSAIERALREGWVFTFPQGTTRPGAPGRRGTAHLIRGERPTVVPVVLSGFRETFDKSGLRVRKPGAELTVRFKAPLQINYQAGVDSVLSQVMGAIEQPHVAADESVAEEPAVAERESSRSAWNGESGRRAITTMKRAKEKGPASERACPLFSGSGTARQGRQATD